VLPPNGQNAFVPTEAFFSPVTKEESMELESVPGVGTKTAEALRELDNPVRALEDGDVATLASAPGISDGRAARLARGAIQATHDDPGGFAATPRAKELFETALDLFRERTVTDDAAARLGTLYPSGVRSRIEEVQQFSERAMEREPTPEVREALSGVEPLTEPSSVRVRDRCLATSDAEQYAAAQSDIPELSVELIEDKQQLSELARSYSTVIALDEAFAGVDVDGDVRVEPDALAEPASVVPERVLSFFAANRDSLRAAAEVHRVTGLEQPCDLDALSGALDRLDDDGSVCGNSELDRLSTAIDDLDAAVSTAESVANDHLRDAIEERDVTIEGTDLLSLVERGAGVDSLLDRELADEYAAAVEQAREQLIETLDLRDTESMARRAFPDEPSYPVEHDQRVVSRLREELTATRDRLATEQKRELADTLAAMRDAADELVEAALELDRECAVARFVADFDCTMPDITEDGGFDIEGGRSPLLDVPFEAVEPVDYSVDGVTILSGVNSGGKTSTLDLVGLITTLAHMGLPVPADHARIGRISELHYHAKTQGTLDAGAFETTIREFGELVTEITADRPVLVLVDELESITEPGAAATIIAGILESLVDRDATGVFVSHLAEDIHEAADADLTIDGIQAEGLVDGELRVDRSPVKGELARSTPELIVEKLADDEAGFYRDLLDKFE
jgi:dsDNA-specific endonuclease/ATPase MutS2